MFVVVCVALLAFTGAAPVNDQTPEAHVKELQLKGLPFPYLFADKTDGNKYYMAVVIHGKLQISKFVCAAGQIFNDEKYACLAPKTDAKMCTQENDLLPDTENCASFYQCSHGIAYRKCCPAGLGWVEAEKTCGYVASCTKAPECPAYVAPTTAEPTTQGPEPETCVIGNYIYAKVEGKPRSFQMTIKETGVVEGIRVCTLETQIFSTRHCGCFDPTTVILPPVKNVCSKLDFKDAFSTNKVYVGFNDETAVKLVNEEACFTAGGLLNIPRYDNAPFGHFELSFKYSVSTATDLAILIGNSKTVKDATFCVYLEKEILKVKITTDKGTFTLEKKAVAGIVTVKYDGEKLVLAVGTEKTDIEATGDIKRHGEPLYLGGGFVGCMDDFYLCKPSFPVAPQTGDA